jgi:hypothetical protein
LEGAYDIPYAFASNNLMSSRSQPRPRKTQKQVVQAFSVLEGVPDEAGTDRSKCFEQSIAERCAETVLLADNLTATTDHMNPVKIDFADLCTNLASASFQYSFRYPSRHSLRQTGELQTWQITPVLPAAQLAQLPLELWFVTPRS